MVTGKPTGWQRLTGISRDSVLFAVGVFIILHETLDGSANAPGLLVAALGLVGAPAVIRAEARRSNGGS